MGAMSQLAMEKDEEINDLRWAYQHAFASMMEYMDKHPPANRTPRQIQEVARLESICDMARYMYEQAEERRYKI